MTNERKPIRVREAFFTSNLEGSYPDISPASDIDLDQLLEADRKQGTEPVYLTLPIAKSGQISENGLKYTEPFVRALVEQINSKRPGGIMGHIKDEDRPYSYPVPDIYWVGAQYFPETGQAWAKGLIPAHKSEIREHFKTLKSLNGKAGTSIYGLGYIEEYETDESGFTSYTMEIPTWNLEQLDLASWDRAAAKQSGEFNITRQMIEENHHQPIMEEDEQLMDVEEGTVMTVGDLPAGLVHEITDTASSEVLKDFAQVLSVETTSKDELLTVVKQLVEAQEVVVAQYVRNALADPEDGVKVPTMRPLIEELVMVSKPKTLAEAKAAIESVLTRENIQDALKEQAAEEMGPAYVPGDRDGNEDGQENPYLMITGDRS